MSDRVTAKLLRTLTQQLALALGLPTAHYRKRPPIVTTDSTEASEAREWNDGIPVESEHAHKIGLRRLPGGLALDYAACYGGYRVEQLCQDSTGVSEFSGPRRSAREMEAWLRGALTVARLRKERDE